MTKATRLSPPNLEGRPTSSNEEEEECNDEISSEQDDSDCHCSDDHEDNDHDDDDSDFICSECDDDDDDENSISSSSSSSSACSREDSHLQDHANAFLSFLQERMIMQMIEDNNNNNEDDDDDDDDSMSSSHGSMPPLFHKNGKEEVEEDPNAPKCAICFSTRRSLEDLPCCGGKAEETTSTRFCRSCLVKTLRSHQSTIAANNTDGILLLCNARNTLVGECPRCRSLIAIPRCRRRRRRLDGSKKKPTAGGGGDTILCADFEEAMSFVYHKESLRKHLFTVAFSNPNYIPKDIFLAFDGVTSSADNAVHQLIQWGILNKKKKKKRTNKNKKKTETDDDVYTLSASDQVLLRNFMSHPHIRPSFFVESSSEEDNDDEEKWKKAALLVVSQYFFEGMIYALLTGFKIVRAIRLLNHSMILFWMAYGYVPPPPTTITSQQQQLSSSSQQHLWLVSLLNIFVACLVIVVVIVVATGAVTVWLAARCVWWILYVPSQQTNSSLSSLQMMMMRMGMVGLVVVMLHYCVVWYKVWILVALRQCMKMIVTIVCRKYNNKSQFATELVPTMLDGLIVAYVFTTLLPNFFGLF